MTPTIELGNQPNTATRVRSYNAVIRYIMWLFDCSQIQAQSPRYALARRRLYNAPTFAPRDV
jgi:hypothetical protein